MSSTPSEASIYLDGVYRGTTPKTIFDVPVRNHSILLTKSGYYDKTATIIVVLNQVAYVSESLDDAKTGEIDISSDPSGAMVYLEDSYKEITPITISDVPEGYHTVKLTKSGYWDYCETLYVSDRSKEFVSGHLSLISTPTPTPSIQAFEVVWAIAGLLAVAYLLRRRG